MNDIAVVGLDCRFPKAGDPPALWKMLLEGADGIDEIPAERWDAAELVGDGTVNHRAGGLIDDADAFDNDFFGIAPREAEAMDPQQRLLLQTAWRALENATLDPRGQAGSNTGVFVGVMANEWAHLHMSDYRSITAQDGSGNGYFMTANRLSYQLDLKGPSLAVDTACSSSLVAVHLAVQALRGSECDQAVAAGVNLALTPALNAFYTKAGLAAPDGRCKPFSGKADGIGRGEGVAVVVLRRLDDAVAAGLPIYAVIKGSAVNSDGRSNGITAPNRWAQQQVAATAYQVAGITPEQIIFLEAHGTGTLLGDMIEAKALAHAHRSRRDTPCGIGSIKGNLGHTEGAAGIAGLIKVVLSLHHLVVPPSRFAETENAQLRLADGGLRLLTEPMHLPTEPTHGGVSSFGIGGTNCHVVLASAPSTEPAPMADGTGVLTLSADSSESLRRNALQLSHDIESSNAPLVQLCWSTNRIKATGKARLAIVTDDRSEAVAALRGEFDAGIAAAMSTGWLFSGQGTQHPGMATALYERHALFRDSFDEVDAAIAPFLDQRIRDVMNDEGINRTEFAQPAIFALQYAQAQALIRLGAEPAWLLGHSIGEYAAAAIAEVFSLDDACRLVVARGRLMQRLPAGGGMLAVRATLGDVSGLPLDLAAVNGANEVVLSGATAAIEDSAHGLEQAGITVRRLNVSHAFHSQLMEPMMAEFASVAAQCSFELPAFPIFSTLHGRLLGDDEPMDANYWTAHVRSTVRFADAAAEAMHAEPTHLVEFGARRTLGPMIMRSHGSAPPALDVATDLHATVAALYRGGLNPDWDLLYPKEARVPHRLSAYSFSTANRYWIREGAGSDVRPAASSAALTDSSKDSTMDNLIALFREQAAVLAAYGRPPATAAIAPQMNPETNAADLPASTAETAAVVRAEIARVSGFPEKNLRATQTIAGDLGFDSIMVADVFSGLTRKIPGLAIDAGSFTPDTTIADVIGMAGGQTQEPTPTAATDATVVAPQFRIGEFEEIKALADRFAFAQAIGVDNPYFLVNDGVTRDTSIINGAEVINFSSYNYLGMSGHPAVADAVSDAVRRWGSSCSASRPISGEKPVHRELEVELAKLLGTEDAIALVSGHATNVTVIGHLLGQGDLVIHDSLAHDSIMQGCVLSGATRRPFPHNDHAALDQLLTGIRHQYRRVLIIIEGIYSQDGDIPDLPAFIEVKRNHHALLMIDEAHSIGVLGETGGGIGEHFGVDRADVELWSGTMSKALAGCGGYVGGSRELVEFLKYTTPGFVYSVGMPPPTAAASLAAIRTIRREPEHLQRLRELSRLFLGLAREAGLDTGDSEGTPVIPCIVGSSATALKLSNILLRRGINANPIIYPAVPEDKARLRFFVTSCHSEEQIRYTVKALTEELKLLTELS
jgi:8-amino-7-oxononanoate synthase